MKRFLPAFVAGNLRYRFMALAIPLALAIGVSVLSVFLYMAQNLVRELGDRTATNQVLLDRARAELPLWREITLAEALAGDPTIIAWSKSLDDPALRERGIATLERFRVAFRDHSYFFVPDASLEFYAHDDAQPAGSQLVKYILSKDNPDDAWYFSTVALPGVCFLNVDFDRALHETKVWMNCNIRDPETNKVLGIIGSGLDLTKFIDDLQKSLPDGVTAIYADKNGAIQAHPDVRLIEQDALTKPGNLTSTIFNLVDDEDDKERLADALARAGKEPDTASTTTVSIDGSPYLVGISFIPEINWFSVSVMDLRTLAFGTYFMPVALLMAAAIVLSLSVLGIALNKTVLKRIYRLDRAVTAFKNGSASGIDAVGESEGMAQDQIGRLGANFNELAETVRRHTAELEQRVAERTRELQELVGRDPLTGARNRRSFYEAATEEKRRAERFGGHSSVLMMDLDRFKSVNDTYGHIAGDETIKRLADLCGRSIRDIDVFARMGGEEFAAILINTGVDDASAVAERIRLEMKDSPIATADRTFTCTVSIGVAHWDAAHDNIDKALNVADKALYEAKQSGRDKVVVARQPDQAPPTA